MYKTGIHVASSRTWGDSACARLCGIIVESNTGIAQQISENRTDLLELYTNAELEEPDDLGLTVQFLAVHYDQPDMLVYFHKRGIDLNAPCDPMGFGNPMFYAIRLGKHRIVRVLDMLGCRVTDPCDEMKQSPLFHADRINDEFMRHEIHLAETKEYRAAVLFHKNFLKSKYRRKFLHQVKMIIQIQRIMRGVLGRVKAIKRKEEYELWKLRNPDGVVKKKKSKKKSKKKKIRKRASSDDDVNDNDDVHSDDDAL
mmetsp:Transcript_6061/g.9156  ORF Transcript_6061/g.9156 Transcript_6061/m.9156 type:complete len:255 (-) Transcript_6061:178-942(-)|eukprot:CAMPEP_0185041158 /NCGR_PEP_ID=MMETSP1103-20130426/40070_1 /TAXON_ID=36769 /ORGANISM="Paraphysomonas bandaiensis, Strain Caron Lab Isolate" /LENGTH=254 /DNA_ID=CAMNT_0027580765 /DNA_START=89 /DNA_END=853 /DNA_ORIENTATION=-